MKNGDTVGDISRLFIYYVGRKADQVRNRETHMPVADAGMYVCVCTCMYVCMHVCTYVCMYVYERDTHACS